MENKFAAVARKETALSPVMEGRTKVSTDDMIAQYPDGFTVVEFDVISISKGTFPVMAIKENPEICFFGGTVLMTIAKAWADTCGGDVAQASAELAECGGVRMKLRTAKTKDGNNLTAVDIL